MTDGNSINAPPDEKSYDAVGPLSGIKVLDLGAYIAAPYGCSLLADLGAEVIKIEPPSGDTLRTYPSTLKHESRGFLGVNHSKLSVCLDLKNPQGLAVLLRLIETADVAVHNFRPSVPPRLGIDYEGAKKINPRIIYCSLTGYGDVGPFKDKAGYDQVLQSMTGIAVFQGKSRGFEEPEIVAGSIVDYYAAANIAFGVCAALFHRERTGQGQSISISLLASALSMQSTRFIWADSESREVGRDMRSGGITGIHPTKQGCIYISANTPHFWKSLCELTGLPEMAEDIRFNTLKKRAEHEAEIVPEIRRALKAHTALEWEQLFGERVPCCAVRAIEDMFDHPQVLATGLVTTFDHPVVGSYRGLNTPIKFGIAPGPAPFAAPTLGQHSEEVLANHGYTAEEINILLQQKVIIRGV